MTKTIVNGQIVEQPAQLKSIELFYALNLSDNPQKAAASPINTEFLNHAFHISLVHNGLGGQNDLIKVITSSGAIIYYVGRWNDGLVNQPKKKPIVLKYFLNYDKIIEKVITSRPKDFNYVELLVKEYLLDTDLIYCYLNADNKGDGTLYLGQWNDGIVE